MMDFKEDQKISQVDNKSTQINKPTEAVVEIDKKRRGLQNIKARPKVLPSFRRIALKVSGLFVLCAITSGLTAWILVGSGWVGQNVSQGISENREKIVLQEGEIVADVFDSVSPSTVSITTQAVATSSYYSAAGVQEGEGSGIIISSDGYILTNKHVVPAGATSVKVVLADGREFSNVKVVGRDPFNDIAFIKIDGVTDLKAATLGDSASVKTGQKVIAIGNALGEFSNSVTAGIISGVGRPVEASDGNGASERLENLLQTDAAINPGNSGGPLLNIRGEVIGVNTAIAESSQSIGFAIPINDVKSVIKTVLEQGRVVKPYLGVRYITLDSEAAQQLGITQTTGAYVSGGEGEAAVIIGSPADKAGIKQKDIIIKVDGEQITETNTLSSVLAKYAPGDKISLTILRDGQEQSVQVTLETYPN